MSVAPSTWYRVPLTEVMKAAAKKQADSLGSLRHSIRGGKGNYIGFLGEEAVRAVTGAPRRDESTDMKSVYSHDMVAPNGTKLEVKSKEVTSCPKPFYDCSVCNWNPRQACDCYVFVRVLNDYSVAWVLGAASREHYFKTCTYHRKGEKDARNNFTFRANCYNLPINKLQPLTDFVEPVPLQVEDGYELYDPTTPTIRPTRFKRSSSIIDGGKIVLPILKLGKCEMQVLGEERKKLEDGVTLGELVRIEDDEEREPVLKRGRAV